MGWTYSGAGFCSARPGTFADHDPEWPLRREIASFFRKLPGVVRTIARDDSAAEVRAVGLRKYRALPAAIVSGALLVAIVGLPCSLLVFRPHALLGGDYTRHYWMAGYLGEYFKQYHRFAVVYQTQVSLGVAFPVLYGVLFYRLVGLVATVFEPGITLRIALVTAVAAEVIVVFRAARALRAGRGIALLYAAGVAFSVYQLTNLYNRADLTEFVAVTLSTVAVGAWFWSRAEIRKTERWLARSIMAAALTLLCGTHTISLMLGGATFFFCAGVTLMFDRSRSALVSFGIAAAAYLAGATMFLVGYVLVTHEVRFSSSAYAYGFMIFGDRIDSPIARFAPFPLDPQSLYHGLIDVSTPYLEAPIDYTLLVLAAAAVIFRRNALVMVLLGAALLLAVLTVWPWFWNIAPAPLHFLQFPYRLVSYVNILALSAALGALFQLPVESRRVARTPVPAIVATLAVIACLIKLNHSNAVMVDDLRPTPQTDFSVGGEMAGVDTNYTTRPLTGRLAPEHPDIPSSVMAAIGRPLPVRLIADRRGLIFTRILVFPWNEIIVDGKALAPRDKLAWKDSYYYGFRAKPGSAHYVQTAFDLPAPLDRAIGFVQVVFVFEILAVLTALVQLFLQRRGRRKVAN